LLAILERVDPKTSGVEELLAPAGVVEAGLASRSFFIFFIEVHAKQ
jgi:hypothetical protein